MSPSTRCICVIVALSACSTTAVREQAHVTAGSSSISSPVKESTASAGVPTAASSPRTVTPTNSAAPFGPAQPATPSAQPATRAATATVAWSVVDGDTLDVQGTDGRVTVRLIGMNAPEKDECFAMQATAAMQQLLAGHTVTLVKDVSETDQYGRLLRFVETDAGVDVGAEIVRGGFAVSRRYPPDIARNSTYDELQTQAQAAGAGEWAANACGPAACDASCGGK